MNKTYSRNIDKVNSYQNIFTKNVLNGQVYVLNGIDTQQEAFLLSMCRQKEWLVFPKPFLSRNSPEIRRWNRMVY
jgi:hypothetical protein